MKTEGDKTEAKLDEKSPPGWKGTVKAMKKHMPDDKAFALAWSMKKKGMKPHYKMGKDGEPVKKDEDFRSAVAELRGLIGEGRAAEGPGEHREIPNKYNKDTDGMKYAIVSKLNRLGSYSPAADGGGSGARDAEQFLKQLVKDGYVRYNSKLKTYEVEE